LWTQEYPDETFVWCAMLQHKIDWLIIYCYTSRSRIFQLYGDVTIAGEGLQNLGLRSTGPLSREGSLSCHTCCDTGLRLFRSHPKDRSIQSPLMTHKGMWRIYSNRNLHGSVQHKTRHEYFPYVHVVNDSILNNQAPRPTINWELA
jgi:hypothetical protein